MHWNELLNLRFLNALSVLCKIIHGSQVALLHQLNNLWVKSRKVKCNEGKTTPKGGLVFVIYVLKFEKRKSYEK